MRALFVVLDTLRRDYLPCYGNEWVQAPACARLASEGVTFDNHWAGSLPCMPARREFLTGRHNFLHRGWGPIEPFDDVLPRLLREGAGVFSHLLTDHDHYFELGGENYHTAYNTWEFFRGQENDPWVSRVDTLALPHHEGRLTPQNWANRQRQQAETDFSGPRTVQAAMKWLETNQNADNWLLQVELFDPHEPFTCPAQWRALYGDSWGGALCDWPVYGAHDETPEATAHLKACYAGLLSMTDYWLGRLWDTLDALRLWDDCLIVLTTDHGTLLGEHGFWMKNVCPVYPELARLPLIVKRPGDTQGTQQAGTRVAHLTQTIDIMPTLLEAFGAVAPPHVYGKSLLSAMDGNALREDALFGYFGMAVNITDGRTLYFRNPVNGDGGPLFAYTSMPIKGLNTWFAREDYPRVEMGRYFGHTYSLPVYRFPAQGRVPLSPAGDPHGAGQHALYDLSADPLLQAPLQDDRLEAHFAERIRRHLTDCDAPPEQWTRLGLTPSGPTDERAH